MTTNFPGHLRVNTVKNVIVAGGGELRGKYLKMEIPLLFRYQSQTAKETDIEWAPEWVEDPDEATDYFGQCEALISWIHRFKGEGQGFTWVNRQVVTKPME